MNFKKVLFFQVFVCCFLFVGALGAQNFKVTLDLDYLNDGKKKSLLFTDESGEYLHFMNFKKEGFTKDFVIEFQKPEGAKVHLTEFKQIEFDINNPLAAKEPRTVVTFCNISNNSVLNYIKMNEVYSFLPEASAEIWEEKLIDISGVRSVEDIILENVDYRITKNRIRRDSILRLRVSRRPGKDALIFLKINNEDLHRQIYLPSQDKMPRNLSLDDLVSDIEIAELKFPTGDKWHSRVTATNLENGNEFIFQTTGFEAKELGSIYYPVPEELVLENFKIDFRRRDIYSERSHFYHQFFDQAPRGIFHYEDFDFEGSDEFRGFELSFNDESDFFEVNVDFKGMSKYSTSDIKLFNWRFYGKVGGRKKIRINYPKEIPEGIQKHLGGLWDGIKYELKLVKAIKAANVPNLEDTRPIDILYFLRDDSYHQCSQYFR